MKRFIVKCVEIVSYIGFFAFIIAGASGGYQRVSDLGGAKPVWGIVLGAILGFVLAVIVFGVLFLLLDIADNTRRTRELLERRP
jgi:TRAP-type C4-dicarboxylate transport system permease small subunit